MEKNLQVILSDCLASILNVSLRQRPNSESMKTTCRHLKVPSNIPSMKVPQTNMDITIVMSVVGKLLDARLTHTNSLLLKAVFPIAQGISDIGEKADKPLNTYLGGFNNNLRLVISAFTYINQLRKEVVRFPFNNTGLAELCKCYFEVKTDELLPFDVFQKCDKIHKTKKLGKPSLWPREISPVADSCEFNNVLSCQTHQTSLLG